MSATITTTAANPLLDLLQVFGAESLGEGDMAAGAYVLAAMCASLANLHPPGTCLVTEQGECLAVGTSFAAIGGLTDSLVREKALDPIARIQNNLGEHLAADAAHAAAKLAAIPPQERLRIRPPPPDYTPALTKVHTALNGFSAARDSAAFGLLIAPCRDQGASELVTTPAVFLDACSAAGLEKQLAQAHRRHPYVRAVLADGPGSERLESILLSVLRGTSLSAGTGPELCQRAGCRRPDRERRDPHRGRDARRQGHHWDLPISLHPPVVSPVSP